MKNEEFNLASYCLFWLSSRNVPATGKLSLCSASRYFYRPTLPLSPPWSVSLPPPASVPPGVVGESPLGSSSVVLSPPSELTRFRLMSRLVALNSPVPRARSLKPSMFFCTENSFSVLAPILFLMPMEKMARSSILMANPWEASSLTQITMSVIIPLMAPLENGVL